MTAAAAVNKKTSAIHVEDEFGEVIVGQTAGKVNYAVSDRLGPISGFTNYNVREMHAIAQWRRNLSRVYELNGFTPLEPRPVEYAENLQLKGGMTKQMYGLSRLQDGGLTKLGIPFDRTLPLAIFVAQHMRGITFPYLRYDIGYSFRGEKAGPGRYRAFIQADNDIIDTELTARSDAQAIVTMLQGVESLGVIDYRLHINHIVVAKFFIKDAGVRSEHMDAALRIIDKLKPHNFEAVVKELVATVSLSPQAAVMLLRQMQFCGPLSKFQLKQGAAKEAVEAYNHLKDVIDFAVLMGIRADRIVFSPGLTRGLDYYTGVVFETFIPSREHRGSVASGGRYDGLIDGLGNKNTKLQGVGGSIGVTRLFDFAKDEGFLELHRQTCVQILVGFRTPALIPQALTVATELRKRKVSVEVYSAKKVKIDKQLDLCNKKGIGFAVLVMNATEIILKNLGMQTQETFPSMQTVVARVAELRTSGELSVNTLRQIQRIVFLFVRANNAANIVMQYYS